MWPVTSAPRQELRCGQGQLPTRFLQWWLLTSKALQGLSCCAELAGAPPFHTDRAGRRHVLYWPLKTDSGKWSSRKRLFQQLVIKLA